MVVPGTWDDDVLFASREEPQWAGRFPSCSVSCLWRWVICSTVLGLRVRGPRVRGTFLKVHCIPAAVHPSQGRSSEYLTFHILHPSQACLMTLRPGAARTDMMKGSRA
jgi:hypothetical protein